VFGDADAARREQLLDHLLAQLRHRDVWLASVGDIVDWWCQREHLRVTVGSDTVAITNTGERPVAGARVAIESRRGIRRELLPPLGPGACVLLRAPWQAGAATTPLEVVP
jgi:hypothetical protein